MHCESYQDANFLYMVFDCFAGREIKYGLQDIVQAPEKVVAELMYKLLQALSHCHSKNVFHRYLYYFTEQEIWNLTLYTRDYLTLLQKYVSSISTQQRFTTQMNKISTKK